MGSYLRQREMLLVLDNFEHLLEGMETVTGLLSRAPGVKVLVTSRVRLNVQGEYLLPVGGHGVSTSPLPVTAIPSPRGRGGRG